MSKMNRILIYMLALVLVLTVVTLLFGARGSVAALAVILTAASIVEIVFWWGLMRRSSKASQRLRE